MESPAAMTESRWERLRALYEEALALAPERRMEFVVNTCADDSLMREQLLSLIAASGTDHLDDAPTRAGIQFRPLELAAGATVGRYTIIRLLGQGGMGAVYLAERADREFHHRVAIKIVADGILSSRIMARLRSERQILAHLNHPNIAKLFDGGATAEGIPYFAMEYVDGQRIDGYCRDRNLSVKDRLRLFRQVCAAVQYAHAQLIIHRDLKPSNILVTKDGTPKLLDFGIAKLLDPNSASRSSDLTQIHERVLSPEYASPEQIRGESVGTASDIYALGILLYELLTQRRPHAFGDKTIPEIEHEILEHAPLKPSAAICLSMSDSERRTAWIKALRGDLDTIVMKALHIDATERYVSVEALSEDIENYLENRPIKARPDRWTYRARKFWQRNRWSIAGAGIAVSAIVALIIVYTSRLATERDIANRERATAARVSEFMTEVFRVANPSESRGDSVPAREVLDGAVKRIQRDLSDQPRVRVELMEKMAQAYVGIGLWTSAENLLKSAVEQAGPAYGTKSMEFAEALTALAAVQHRLAHFEDERRSLTTSLQIRETPSRRIARSSILTLVAWADNQSARGKSDDALATLGRAESLAKQPRSQDSALMGEIYASYGRTYHDVSRYKEAEQYLQLALPLLRGTINQGADRYADATLMLSECMVSESRDQEAIAFLHQRIGEFEKIFGPAHPMVGDAWNMLAIAYCDSGEYTPCSTAFQRSVDIERKQAPQGSRRQIMLFANLGSAYHDAGRLDAALQALDHAIELSHAYSKPHDLTLLGVYYEKAGALRELGKLREAEAAIEQTDSILLTETDQERSNAFVNVERGRILYAKHQYAAAEHQLRTALASIPAEEPRAQANAHLAIGRTLIALHRCNDGIAELRAAYDVRKKVMPKQNWFIYEAESALGDGLSQCAQFEAAEPLLQNSVHELRALRSSDDRRLAEAEQALADHKSRVAQRMK
jgi:serine/threonine-protein kinase